MTSKPPTIMPMASTKVKPPMVTRAAAVVARVESV